VRHDEAAEGDRRGHAGDVVLVEGAPHAAEGLFARAAPRDQLRDHGVVVDLHLAALLHARIHAHAEAAGQGVVKMKIIQRSQRASV